MWSWTPDLARNDSITELNDDSFIRATLAIRSEGGMSPKILNSDGGIAVQSPPMYTLPAAEMSQLR